MAYDRVIIGFIYDGGTYDHIHRDHLNGGSMSAGLAGAVLVKVFFIGNSGVMFLDGGGVDVGGDAVTPENLVDRVALKEGNTLTDGLVECLSAVSYTLVQTVGELTAGQALIGYEDCAVQGVCFGGGEVVAILHGTLIVLADYGTHIFFFLRSFLGCGAKAFNRACAVAVPYHAVVYANDPARRDTGDSAGYGAIGLCTDGYASREVAVLHDGGR